VKLSQLIRLSVAWVSVITTPPPPQKISKLKADDLQWAIDVYNRKRSDSPWITNVILKERSAQDKDFLNSLMEGYDQLSLPAAILQENKILFLHEGKRISLEIVDATKGIFLVQGKKLSLDNKKPLKDIFELLSNTLGKNHTSQLLDIFIPPANALALVITIFVLAVALAILSWIETIVFIKLLNKGKKSKKKISFLRDIKNDCKAQKREMGALVESQSIHKNPISPHQRFPLIVQRNEIQQTLIQIEKTSYAKGVEYALKEEVKSCLKDLEGLVITLLQAKEKGSTISGERHKYPTSRPVGDTPEKQAEKI